ncbi:MAG: efflux RND transporter permease subunit, partial [Chloroflexota bacterium]|nr:efflux RND transporter permease subunit [Chloroflexota bacterium]
MWLWDISVKRPVFITMVMLALVVMGAIAYTRLGVDLYPDVSFPVVAVQTAYPGASPDEVESQVSKPLEEALSSLSGVRAVRSTSSEGLSLVIVEYNLEYPIAKGVEEVRERVYVYRGSLPQDIYDPVIMRFDPAMMPVLSFAVTDKEGTLGPMALRKLAEDKIVPRIERIEGVAAAQVEGGLEREIQVELSADRLRSLGIAPQQVVAAIKGENLSIPGGRLEDGSRELLLRTPGNFQRWEEIGRVVVANRGGTPIYVRDVAEVRDGIKDVRYHTRLDGTNSVMVL